MKDDLLQLSIFQCIGCKGADPAKTASIFVHPDGGEEAVSYKDIFEKSNRMAHALSKAGIGKGDTFAIVMKNQPELLYAVFAALTIGAVAVPIDPRSRLGKLAYQINNTCSKGILVSDECLPFLQEIEDRIQQVPILGVSYKPHHDIPVNAAHPVLNETLDHGPCGLPDRRVPLDFTAPAQIIHTSGTTGDPKGVVLNADRFMVYGIFADLMWQYQPDDIPYTGLSMTHGNAQSVTVIPALAKGLTAVVSERFTKSRIWDICRKYGCTTFSLLGGMMAGIYNEPAKEDDGDNPVRKVISAGTPRAIWEAFEKRFNVRIHEWYAAVEGGLANNPPGSGPVGSFGKPPQGLIEMKIVDENDQEVPPGVEGELISRMQGAETTVSYYGQEEASRRKTRGGWLRSGDICHMDADGYFYFDYRKGGGLRRQGDFIQPDRIEKIIGEQPTVSEVCVYGIPAASGAPGESDLVAALSPFPGSDPDLEAVRSACRAELERNALPSFFQIVDEIPKTASEKHLERILREGFSPGAPNVVKF